MPQFSYKKINKYLNLAKNASLESDFHQHKLGAVLVYRGIPLAYGHNSRKTSPVQKHYNRERDGYDVEADCINSNSLHSEVACLLKVRNLDIDFSKATLFVYRQHRDGKKALAKPCQACESMIRELGIKNVIYTTNGGWCHECFD